MVPKEGYWRWENTDVFYECVNQDSCLGGENPHNSEGNCDTGYTGILCHHCQDNYSRSFGETCLECPDEAISNIILVAIIIGVSIIFLLLIRSLIQSAYTEKSLLSVYIKIMLNYISLIASVT